MRSIALVEWTWVGHHPTYFNYFITALEQLEMDVLALCPNPVEAEELANQTRQRAGAANVQRSRTQFRQLKIPARRFHNLRPRRIGAIDWTLRHFPGVENQVREWTRESGRSVDGIIYACMYDRDFAWVHLAKPLLRLPWMGLYLHAMPDRMAGHSLPHHGRLPSPKQMFSGRLCKSIATLDEGIAERLSRALDKPVVALPDLADERPATTAEDRILGERLQHFAAGRPVVGLFGHLQKSKGILTFLEASRMPGAAGICFALGGDLIWPPDADEARQLRCTLAESPNLWCHLARIPTEPGLSHLMAACDAIVAAYVDFPHSSGIQTKAAFLNKPLIVSDGYLMAERARRYKSGEVIPQCEAPALLHAILKITKDPAAWIAYNKPRWDDYCRDHSFARLKAGLTKLMDSI